jgi:hypothetical protein
VGARVRGADELMAETLLIPKQLAPAAATLTPIYTVPPGTYAVLSRIVITNRDPAPTSYRVSIAVAGAADDPSQYLAYDMPVYGNDSLALLSSKGVTLGPGDEVRVYATDATLSFAVFGVEQSGVAADIGALLLESITANTAISALTAGAPAVGTDELVVARAGNNRRLSVTDVLALVPGAVDPVALLLEAGAVSAKLSALSSGSPAVGSDEVHIARAGASLKLTLTQLLALVSTDIGAVLLESGSNTKISALTSGSPAVGTDELVVNRAGASRKLTLTEVLALAAGGSGDRTTLFTDPTAHTTVGTTLVSFYSVAIPAGTFAADGDSLEIMWSGLNDGTASARTITPKFNSTALIAAGASTANADYYSQIRITRRNSTTIVAAAYAYRGTAVIVDTVVISVDPTLAATFGFDVTTIAAGSFTSHMLTIEKVAA